MGHALGVAQAYGRDGVVLQGDLNYYSRFGFKVFDTVTYDGDGAEYIQLLPFDDAPLRSSGVSTACLANNDLVSANHAQHIAGPVHQEDPDQGNCQTGGASGFPWRATSACNTASSAVSARFSASISARLKTPKSPCTAAKVK